MTRFVIGPDVAIILASKRAEVGKQHRLLAPTLMRSQVLAMLYGSVKRGEIDQTDAKNQLDHIRKLNIRLLGDRVLQQLAWKISDELKWSDTYTAEYVALTKLQADAFITQDGKLKRAVKGMVKLANLDDLLGPISAKPVAKDQRRAKRGGEK